MFLRKSLVYFIREIAVFLRKSLVYFIREIAVFLRKSLVYFIREIAVFLRKSLVYFIREGLSVSLSRYGVSSTSPPLYLELLHTLTVLLILVRRFPTRGEARLFLWQQEIARKPRSPVMHSFLIAL